MIFNQKLDLVEGIFHEQAGSVTHETYLPTSAPVFTTLRDIPWQLYCARWKNLKAPKFTLDLASNIVEGLKMNTFSKMMLNYNRLPIESCIIYAWIPKEFIMIKIIARNTKGSKNDFPLIIKCCPFCYKGPIIINSFDILYSINHD